VCGRVRTLAAEFAGVSERTMQDVITVDHHDRDLFEQIFNGAISAKKARKQLQQRQRHAGIGEAPPLPGGRFGLIYADPPWQLGNPDSDYAPEQYYPTMPLAEICALRVPAAVDALLYLWAVNSHLRDALSVMDAWGFVYVANFAWDKGSIGMGVWARNQHELLLVGRKGKASPPSPADRQPSVIAARRGRHSEKPVVVCQMLERMHPHLSKLELFARGTPRPGWTVWGNEVDQAEAA
jgi:N6-adenosine-specific RNA methylase IME4